MNLTQDFQEMLTQRKQAENGSTAKSMKEDPKYPLEKESVEQVFLQKFQKG